MAGCILYLDMINIDRRFFAYYSHTTELKKIQGVFKVGISVLSTCVALAQESNMYPVFFVWFFEPRILSDQISWNSASRKWQVPIDNKAKYLIFE